jgi:putative transposase
VIIRLIKWRKLLYLLRSGCAWRLLPHDFPNWKTVYGVFRSRRNDGTWQQIHDSLRDKLCCREGRNTSPSAAIIDSQSAKTTEVGGPKGFDAGKKINGRKRHIVVDTLLGRGDDRWDRLVPSKNGNS